MEMRSPLVQLALLEALKSKDFTDEIDLFMPFIAVILSSGEVLEVTPEYLQEQLVEAFNIKPPLAAVKVFMTRARKKGLLKRENHVLIPVAAQIDKWKNGYDGKREGVEVSLALLRKEFQEFSSEKFNKTLNDDESDYLLTNFIEKNISSVTSNARYESESLKEKIKNTDHVTASFIGYIHRQKSAALDHFSMIVKGMTLANYLCYADKVSDKKVYKSLSVYLDTPIVVGLLGFSGDQKRNSLEEFIALLKEVGISINIFDKTLSESEQLLGAWRDDLRRRNYSRFNTKTLELLRLKGFDAERLDTEIKLLKSNVENLGIKVQLGFRSKEQFQCDERSLEKALKPNFKSHKNLEHDTICISRIHTLREGRIIDSLNQSFSVFVTPNTGLVSSANRFFRDEIPEKAIPLVVSKQWMTAMFWLKKPELFSSLPLEQIVASAYGLLYTDDKFWHSFVNKLETLEKGKAISEEDFSLVRWDSDLLAMIHDVSVEVGEDFKEEDVFSIVESIKSKHLAEKQEEINKLNEQSTNQIDTLTETISRTTARGDNLSTRFESQAGFLATIASLVPCLFAAIAVFYATLCSVPEQFQPFGVEEQNRDTALEILALAITFVITFVGSFWGVTIFTVYKWLQKTLKEKIYYILSGERL